MEPAVLRGSHYWSKATVIRSVSVSDAILSSPKTIVHKTSDTVQTIVECVYVCVQDSNATQQA